MRCSSGAFGPPTKRSTDGFQPKMQICPYGVTPTSRMRRDRKKPKRYAGKQTMQMRKGEERT